MAQAHSRRYTLRGIVFYLTALVICLFTFASILRSTLRPLSTGSHILSVRDLAPQDLECRLVHHAPDKCSFVKTNCPDEEAGLVSYLQLYYCSLPQLKPVTFTIFVVWISLLFSTIGIAASDFLSINLSTISNTLGMSESLAGVTFLAFGNGSPDVFSTFAAMRSHSGSLAVGELMGAAGFITAVVAGSMALVKPFKVAKKSFVRDVLFFTFAASFSLVFLADGRLRLWECVAMVAFYIFYVCFVVCWHWWIQRNRRIKLSEHVARSHHHIPNQQELEIPEIEDDEEARPTSERTSLLGDRLSESYVGTPAWKIEDVDPAEDDDDDARNRALAELSSNMRVRRQTRGERRNTVTPIRPSLIGALEFRSILSNLERKSSHSRPINLRRYSDEPPVDTASEYGQENHHTSNSVSIVEGIANTSGNYFAPRARAVSANDATTLGIDRDLLDIRANNLSPINASPRSPKLDTSFATQQETPPVFLSPATLTPVSGNSSPTSMHATRNGLLAPPGEDLFRPDHLRNRISDSSSVAMVSAAVSPTTLSPQNRNVENPPAVIVTSSGKDGTQYPHSPVSRPPSIRLPSASMSAESSYSLPFPEQDEEQELTRYSWWPYNYLPPPQIILATLFPTLYGWQERSLTDKMLGIVTAPSVFLLTITLPVVEPDREDDSANPAGDVLSPNLRPARLPADSPELHAQTQGMAVGTHSHGRFSRQNTDLSIPKAQSVIEARAKGWNRWLVVVQIFTAPFFTVLIVWANLDEANKLLLLRMVLGSLVFSLIGLFILLLTTTSDREPRYRSVLCFLGFTVAIAWISTIANEVVGVLKAIGVILNISDAILGLTIFAVGNSLGDLVADITVARLGYPVMALSACFGGPMLNILLGIGLGGMYMTISHATHKHHKHPGKAIHYKPYELEVSTTLMISGITLLVTLVGLLIVVPLNKWRMDRKIGVGLIVLWSISTLINVILEVLGYDSKLDDWVRLT